MSIELVKKWLDDSASVTSNEIEEAMQQTMLLPPTDTNIFLIASLSGILEPILDSGMEPPPSEMIRYTIEEYEKKITE